MNRFPFLKKALLVVLPLLMFTALGCSDNDTSTSNSNLGHEGA